MTQKCCSFNSIANFFCKPCEQSEYCAVNALSLAVSIFAGLASLGSIHIVCGLYLCCKPQMKSKTDIKISNAVNLSRPLKSPLRIYAQNKITEFLVFQESPTLFMLSITEQGKAEKQFTISTLLNKPTDDTDSKEHQYNELNKIFDQAEADIKLLANCKTVLTCYCISKSNDGKFNYDEPRFFATPGSDYIDHFVPMEDAGLEFSKVNEYITQLKFSDADIKRFLDTK